MHHALIATLAVAAIGLTVAAALGGALLGTDDADARRCTIPDALEVARVDTDIWRSTAIRSTGFDGAGAAVIQIECTADQGTVEGIRSITSSGETFEVRSGERSQWSLSPSGNNSLPWRLVTTDNEIAVIVRVRSEPEDAAGLLRSVLGG